MDLIFLFTFFGSLFILLLIIFIVVRSLKNSSENTDNDDVTREVGRQRTGGGRVRPGEPGLRRRAVPRNNRPPDGSDNQEDDQFENDDDIDDDAGPDMDMPELPKGKIGVKKQRKLEMKAERKLARERELQEREERKRLMEEREKQQKLEEEKARAEEKAKEEAERLEKERKEREEHELYLQMKQSFTVDEEGYDGDANEEEGQNKLQAFIDYIKCKKVVHMDELAGHFNMKTSEAIQRIQDMLENELLVGVIDDRGKFIYITNDELEAVAKFIRQRGRVSLTELAENSNNLVKLVPTDVAN